MFASNDNRFGFNSTSGGDGGYVYTPEVRAKIGAAGKGRAVSEDHKSKLRVAMLGKPKAPEAIAKCAEKRRGLRLNDEWRAALSAAHKGNKPSDETRARMTASQTARHAATGVGKAHSEKMRELWANPEFRQKVLAKHQERVTSEEHREKMRSIAASRQYTDELRHKLRDAANRRWSKHKEIRNSELAD
jgi:hypothetical protein